MDTVEKILTGCRLCSGMSEKQIEELLADNGSEILNYKKGEMIFLQGDIPQRVYVLLEGKVTVSKSTCSGRRILLSTVEQPGELFGEVYLFMGKNTYEVEVQAIEDTTVLALSDRIFAQSPGEGKCGNLLIHNLLGIFATKAYHLSNKVRLLGSGSIREKLAVFLLEREGEDGMVHCPFNREELADFMNVTRPSLSREMMNMVDDGLISLDGKRIVILDRDALEDYL